MKNNIEVNLLKNNIKEINFFELSDDNKSNKSNGAKNSNEEINNNLNINNIKNPIEIENSGGGLVKTIVSNQIWVIPFQKMKKNNNNSLNKN